MDVSKHEAFIRRVRDLAAGLYHESLEPIDNEQRLTLLLIDAEQLADAVRNHLYKHWSQERTCG